MLRYISIAAIAFAGVGHLLMAPEHFSHAFTHGIFFTLTGLVQLAWAIAFWRFPSQMLWWPGLALSGGTLVLWALTWLLSVPFALEPEPVDLVVVLIKGSELVGFVALVALDAGYHLEVGTGWTVPRLVAGGLLIPVAVGAGAWGGGHLVEALAIGLGYGASQESANGPADHADDRLAPGPTPDIQAMIAAAVEAALGMQPTPTPAPNPSPDIQAMIAAAVEAALANQSTPPLAPGPTPDDAGVRPTPTIAAINERGQSDGPGQAPGNYVNPTTPEATATPAPAPTSPPAPTAAPLPTGWPLSDPWMSEPEPDATQPKWQRPLLLGIIGVLAVIAAIAVLRNW